MRVCDDLERLMMSLLGVSMSLLGVSGNFDHLI